MQLHDDDSEQVGADVNRMLRALARERQPDPALEENIAQQLRSMRLLDAGVRQARNQRRPRRVAIAWPAAAAAAVLLFVSGVLVGAASGGDRSLGNSALPVASSAKANAQQQGAGDLLLAPGKRTSVKQAIKF